MIVDDAPAFGQAPKDKREQSAGAVLASLQMPAAAHQGAIRTEFLNLQIGERQLAHLLSLALIAVHIAIERRLPAPRALAAGKEAQLRRRPVAGHESLQIALVPR